MPGAGYYDGGQEQYQSPDGKRLLFIELNLIYF